MPNPPADRFDPAVTQRFYSELQGIARRLFAGERSDHTLQPTAVVNEACLRLMTTSPLPDVPREQQLALASRVLRQVLIDHSRGRDADKRGAGRVRVELDPGLVAMQPTFVDVEAVHAALEKLAALHARQSEVVSLRIFGGLGMDEIAAAIGVSRRSVEGDWTVARAWLRRELSREPPAGAR